MPCPRGPATGGIRIAAELATMAAAAEVEKRTRIRLLWIHAAGKVGIGALMLTTGGLHTMEHYVGVGLVVCSARWPWSVAWCWSHHCRAIGGGACGAVWCSSVSGTS